MIPDPIHHALKQLSLALAALGFCVGVLLGYGVLAGDEQGRVNLLFLLLLFAFVPVAGLALSLILILKGGGKGLAGLILTLPMWPRHLVRNVPGAGHFREGNLWLFYQTQILSMSFSCGCLFLYLLLLLGSDISFVWRSTLLEPGNLLPTLEVLALPWQFWSTAQPSLELIESTRDFRLGDSGPSQGVVGLWWQYILAAQITYNLLPRALMLVVARTLYLRRMQQAGGHSKVEVITSNADSAASAELADLNAKVSAPYVLLDWADAPAICLKQIQEQLGSAEQIRKIFPSSRPASGPVSEFPLEVTNPSQSIVVLVKSWEPPLGELGDVLAEIPVGIQAGIQTGLQNQRTASLLPLDWNKSGIIQPTAAHLDEWRRFAATLSNWQVIRLPQIEVQTASRLSTPERNPR